MGNKGSSTSEGSHRRRRDKKRTLSVKAGSHHNPAPGELLKRVRSNIPDSGNILREELFSASCVFREKGDDRNGGGSDTSIVGTGALVLTADQLWFSRYKPRNDLIVALKDIISAEAESAYKLDGKDIKGGPFIVVTFDDSQIGDVNTVVFALKENEDWNIDVNQAAHSARERIPDNS